MVPACSCGTLTNVLPHQNTIPPTQDKPLHPDTVYRHGAALSLYYHLKWYITVESISARVYMLGLI